MTDGYIGFVGIVIVFCALLFLVYVTTKYVGGKAAKAMRGRFINIVETVTIGLDKQIHLLKVGDQYILVASAGKSIEFLTTLELDEAEVEAVSENAGAFDFKGIFDKYLQNFKAPGNSGARTARGGNESKVESEIFKSNLNRLKTINFKFNHQVGNGGDENTNEK